MAKSIALVALRDLPMLGAVAGEVFYHPPIQSVLLINRRHARLASASERAAAGAKPPSRRTYKRRDLVPE